MCPFLALVLIGLCGEGLGDAGLLRTAGQRITADMLQPVCAAVGLTAVQGTALTTSLFPVQKLGIRHVDCDQLLWSTLTFKVCTF